MTGPELDGPVLLVAAYAEPDPVGYNRGVPVQAQLLRESGVPVEILTWPLDPGWTGPRACRGSGVLAGQPYLRTVRAGVPYHVIEPPAVWGERVPTEAEWEAAVAWGMQALRAIRPALVHQHFWQGTWWMMEAAERLGIPVVYTAHDYGIGCLRTVLVTGSDALCDGVVAVEKCSRCIVSGRNVLGRLNEAAAALPGAEWLLTLLLGADLRGPLARVSGVRMRVRRRVALTVERCRRTLGGADAVIAASPFAARFLAQFGVAPGRTHVIPWFYAQRSLLPDPPPVRDTLCLAFVGRISPEKGLHVLLDALARTRPALPVELRIAGSYDSPYGRALVDRFPTHAGPHRVFWAGWVPNERLDEFYPDVHAVVLPSLWYDNTPFSLVEALSHGRPVVCTDVPSMTHLVRHGETGLTFPMGDAEALAGCIAALAAGDGLVARLAGRCRNVPSAEAYCAELREIYARILARRAGSAPAWGAVGGVP